LYGGSNFRDWGPFHRVIGPSVDRLILEAS